MNVLAQILLFWEEVFPWEAGFRGIWLQYHPGAQEFPRLGSDIHHQVRP